MEREPEFAVGTGVWFAFLTTVQAGPVLIPPYENHVSRWSRGDTTLVWSRLRVRDSAVRHCYERGLRLDDELEGTLLLRIEIDQHGLGSVQVLESDLGPAVDACVVEAVEGLDVPQTTPGHVIQLSFPYLFVSTQQTVDPERWVVEERAPLDPEQRVCWRPGAVRKAHRRAGNGPWEPDRLER